MVKSNDLDAQFHENPIARPLHEPPKAECPKDKPYSIFTHGEKWAIVTIASVAGTFRRVPSLCPIILFPILKCLSSPLTANIYFPAIPAMAAAFHKSIELINVTVTVYMVFQGICEFSIVYPKVPTSPTF